MDEVGGRILTGISRAQREYASWTDGEWLWRAPEYMVTTYVAREISRIQRAKRLYLQLEGSVRESVEDAGGVGRGRVSADLRIDGKFDIVLRWANWTPRAAIEIKKQVTKFADVEDDVMRVASMLKRERTTFRDGFVAYYTSWRDNRRSGASARERVANGLLDVESRARTLVERRGLRLRVSRGRTRTVDDSAWAAVVLRVSR